MRIFLAGATGVIGRSLIPLLKADGHEVVGTTRNSAGAELLATLGVAPAVVDVFDAEALLGIVKRAAPEIVIHQLTDLSAGLDPASREKVLAGNARLRREGTANLVRAALAAGARRLIAQSIAWAYAPKQPPYSEADPLDSAATGLRAITIAGGVIPLEEAVLGQPGLEGIVLRYGELYGPGTWRMNPEGLSPVHVDAAALAASLAVTRGSPGMYNIAEPGGSAAVAKAMSELGWNPAFRRAGRL
ncbi:NAD-dependent epimerase/dehydratase family protein [Aestuariivirga sp.]|uniref:NAD-dependent epimerase/dehydratase family protein n=1 Tax=Aestuariivirga sp. TaxID=2650926 RepID=UPI0039E46A47